MSLEFDGSNKRIVLDETTISAQRIWSEWVDWHKNNPNWLLAFKQVGGDDLGSGIVIPPYYFLMNGWRVRPMELSHDLVITGNLFVDGGGIPVVRTLGNYQINTNYTVPVQAQAFVSSGSSSITPNQVRDSVLEANLDNYTTEGTLGYITKKAYNLTKNSYIQNI